MLDNSSQVLIHIFANTNIVYYLYLLLMIGFIVETFSAKHKVNKNAYWSEFFSNVGIILLHQVGKLILQAPLIGLYFVVYENYRLISVKWSVSSLIVAVVITDFIYYWHHYFMHKSGILWAAHVVHHQPKFINLSMATRLSFFNKILTYWFYLPMAVLGFPPLMTFAAGLIDTTYQALSHSKTIKFPRWLSWVFISPQDHQWHHSSDEAHVNKNLGGIFSIWDRIFGTWLKHSERRADDIVFGVKGKLGESEIVNSPIKSNILPFYELLQNVRTKGLRALFW